MNNDLAKRLRASTLTIDNHMGPSPGLRVMRVMHEAADRIEALERSVEFYRAAADQQDMALAAKQECIEALEAALRSADADIWDAAQHIKRALEDSQ